MKILTQSNSGVAVARNNGVAASEGEYACFLDADDWWDANFLEEMDKLIREYPDAGLYATNYVYYKPGKTHVALKLERGYMDYSEAYLHGEMPVWTGAACMPRKVFDEMVTTPFSIPSLRAHPCAHYFLVRLLLLVIARRGNRFLPHF